MMKDIAAVSMTGDGDRDFVGMMIPPRPGAIDMARYEVAYGKALRCRKIARPSSQPRRRSPRWKCGRRNTGHPVNASDHLVRLERGRMRSIPPSIWKVAWLMLKCPFGADIGKPYSPSRNAVIRVGAFSGRSMKHSLHRTN